MLRHIVEECEASRHIAVQRTLELQDVNRAKLVDVSLTPSPETRQRVNSSRQLVVSIFPTRESNTKFERSSFGLIPLTEPAALTESRYTERLHAQLLCAVQLLQYAARQLGAQAVTQLRYRESAQGGPGAHLGKLYAYIVQLKTESLNSPVAIKPLDTSRPYTLHKRIPFPSAIAGHSASYELYIESCDDV